MNPSESFPIPNTLGVESHALMGCRVTSSDEILSAKSSAEKAGLPFTVIGSGSNIVPAPNVERFVCVSAIRGIQDIDENCVRVGAGENWHDFVQLTLERGLFGLENMSLIPGTVGAAPIQNIGAYGVELSTFIRTVHALGADGRQYEFSSETCGFGYRKSRFQTEPELTITHVDIELSRQAHVVTSYPDVSAELAAMGVDEPSPKDVAQSVIAIRRRKLPDPQAVPNVGSFFKNPVVPDSVAATVRARIDDLQTYSQDHGVKLSAAQLIDRLGWKTKGSATVECWKTQPLVIVNLGAESAREILAFAEEIRADVRDQLGVSLELEPSLLD